MGKEKVKKKDRKTQRQPRSKAPSQNVRYQRTPGEPLYLYSPPVWLGPDDGTQEGTLESHPHNPSVSYRKS
jgi:hypothetical protein